MKTKSLNPTTCSSGQLRTAILLERLDKEIFNHKEFKDCAYRAGYEPQKSRLPNFVVTGFINKVGYNQYSLTDEALALITDMERITQMPVESRYSLEKKE